MHTPRLSDWLLLFALVVMWGSSFLFTKIAVTTIPPVAVVGGRIMLAALILIGLVYVSGKRLPRSGRLWLFFVAMAIMGNALPFFLISWGQQRIDSGLAGILMAVMPLTTLVLAHFFVDGERLNPGKLAGFALGFLGIIVLVGPDALRELKGSGDVLISELAVLGGALCYAVNTIIARRRPESDVLVAASGVMICGSLLLFPLNIDLSWLPTVTMGSALAVGFLGVVCTAAATVTYFKVVTSAGPTFLSTMNYLIPLWAVFIGMIFLDERPDWSDFFALILILAGIALSQVLGRRMANKGAR